MERRCQAGSWQTTANPLTREIVAVSGRIITRETLYSRETEPVLYAWRPVLCDPLTAFNDKDMILWSRKQ
ncbi:hypothetical protein TNCV_1006131 [Trichonephila clavipes]|nr:hypothetical protein TNCV_1006131 [Trichonephila clavipes]